MEALTPQQLASFDAFGFLLLPCYSPDEVDALRGETSRLSAGWGSGGSAEGLAPFEAREHLVERSATLTELLVKKVLGPMRQLLGDGLVWSGSELSIDPETPPAAVGQHGVGELSDAYRRELGLSADYAEHHWHSDRPGIAELDYRRVKMLVYLQPTARRSGALRVIAGR